MKSYKERILDILDKKERYLVKQKKMHKTIS